MWFLPNVSPCIYVLAEILCLQITETYWIQTKKEVYSKDTGALGAARKGLNTLLRKVGMRVALGTAAAGIPRHEFSSQWPCLWSLVRIPHSQLWLGVCPSLATDRRDGVWSLYCVYRLPLCLYSGARDSRAWGLLLVSLFVTFEWH